MSAIDFKIDIEKKEDPNGDRVAITMDGKFLPYKSGKRQLLVHAGHMKETSCLRCCQND
ncbi:Cyanate lyase C-terminal domain-containing protein [Alteribacillus persepolensis]|uniref:Cyanate lyase C-terminal domain-containing protein n=1 Tax=Alteribacillus persepolensis TaxID=568899 RepID=A0A1G8FJD7_9BACI|nr:hypothetical protein [Alteribacillus persepolensis]SDH82247.1 Cyanate lyase C-terminal domain-containing protein [Alteribacillus persepolensis]